MNIFPFALLCCAIALRIFTSDEYFIKDFICDSSSCQLWGNQPLSVEEDKKRHAAINQSYTYVGEGGQSYVFASADQRYVLKLFKFRRFRPAWFVESLPSISFLKEFKQEHRARRYQKQIAAFTGHQLAYDVHKEESGLLFMQLFTSDNVQMVLLIDKQGFRRLVNLGAMVYVIQEKGETLSTVLGPLLEAGDSSTAKLRMRQVLDLYHSEYLKGIYDLDHGVMHNIGFVGERPIHLDVGKFVRDETIKDPAIYQKDWIKIGQKIIDWSRKNYPSYTDEIALEVKNIIGPTDEAI